MTSRATFIVYHMLLILSKNYFLKDTTNFKFNLFKFNETSKTMYEILELILFLWKSFSHDDSMMV